MYIVSPPSSLKKSGVCGGMHMHAMMHAGRVLVLEPRELNVFGILGLVVIVIFISTLIAQNLM